MKYTIKFFRDSNPSWKRKQDGLIGYIYRSLSFPCTVLAANLGFTANQVSYMGAAVAVAACALFYVNSYPVRIAAAILFNIWLVMDCVDGNLARGIKKQPFGEFADALGSYLLVNLMGVPLGLAVYREGGVLFAAGNIWMIVLGALASSSDSLMRLVYKNYKSHERDLADAGRLQTENDVFKNPNDVSNIQVRLGYELGIGGILPVLILLATIFHALDLIVLYCFCYYGGACALYIIVYARKAIRREREITAKEAAAQDTER